MMLWDCKIIYKIKYTIKKTQCKYTCPEDVIFLALAFLDIYLFINDVYYESVFSLKFGSLP